MSCTEDSRSGQGLTTVLNLFTPIAGTSPGFTNVPLNGNIGTYTVYLAFVSTLTGYYYYKAYIITCFITGMAPATLSTGNTIPDTGFLFYWIPFVDNYSADNILFYVESSGSTFTLKNTSNSNPVNAMTFSTFLIGL
jgi:hypothetical protein